MIKETADFGWVKIYFVVVWFNPSHQQSTAQLLAHLPLVG